MSLDTIERQQSIRSIWSNARERLEKVNRSASNNEHLPSHEYITAGLNAENRLIAALQQQPLNSVTAIPVHRRYWVLKERDPPSAIMENQHVRVLTNLNLATNEPWTAYTLISRAAPMKYYFAVPDDAMQVLMLCISPNGEAIVVVNMERGNDADGLDRITDAILPQRSYISEMIHQCYISEFPDPKALRYIISQPIYQAGTTQVLKDALKAKNLRKEAKGEWVKGDPGAGLIDDPWHALLGTRNGRVAPHMLADKSSVYGKKIGRIHGLAEVERDEHGSLIMELEDVDRLDSCDC
ncbi:hypothetical protein V8E51_014119 [Hyaloscypha variabilis]